MVIIILKTIGLSFISVLLSVWLQFISFFILGGLIYLLFLPFRKYIENRFNIKKVKYLMGNLNIGLSMAIFSSFFLYYFKLSDYFIHLIPVLYIVFLLPCKQNIDFVLYNILDSDHEEYGKYVKTIEVSVFITYAISFYLFLTIYNKLI